MREIKFRAYIKSLKWMLPVQLINFDDKYVEVDLSDGHGDRSEYTFDEIELMQFIGLKDIDGEVIYEGDVWEKDENNRFIVEFQEGRGGFYPFASGDGCGCCEYDVYESESGKIMGNIYENPELLEVAE